MPRPVPFAISALLALSACTGNPAPPPASLALDPFYAKYLNAGGIPVIGSAKVPDEALRRARTIMDGMLKRRPDLRTAIVRRGVRVAIMAETETTTDLPEQRDWKKPARDDPRLTRCERIHYDVRIGAMTDRAYWDARARGLGGLLTSSSVEDVMGYASSRYYGETLLVHEFAHTILFAVEAVDPALYAEVERAYAAARSNGLWRDEYALTTVHEYWAEGTQFWFNSNRLVMVDGRAILSHLDLSDYDPALYAALGKVYGDSHRLDADPFHNHPARVPPGPAPRNTAEQC